MKKIAFENTCALQDRSFLLGTRDGLKLKNLTKEKIEEARVRASTVEVKSFFDYWRDISQNYKLSEAFMREFADKINWHKISYKQNLSEGFIKEFIDKVDWELILVFQTLSDEFIREFIDKINFYHLCVYKHLSEEFIREFADSFDWQHVSIYQDLSDEFIIEFYDKVDWEYLWFNKKINKKIFEKLNSGKKIYLLINWREVYDEIFQELKN